MAIPKFNHKEQERIHSLLFQVDQNIKTDIQELLASHSGWLETDIRISGFGKLSTVLTSMTLVIKLYYNYLSRKSWWKENESDMPTEDIFRNLNSFISFQRFGFIQGSFMAVESTIRQILRVVDPSKCNEATASYESVYKCLISKLSLDNDWCDFLELWSCIRNTIHNNGIYVNNGQPDKTISYKGKTYQFHNREKVEIASWDLLIDFQKDARTLLREIVDHEEVSGIGGAIQDLYA